MQLTIDKNADHQVKSAMTIDGVMTADLGGFGTFFVSTDDNAMLAVLVISSSNRIYELYPQLLSMQGISQYTYLVVIGNAPASQLLAVQEMGIMTASLDSYELLSHFVKFISDPKRRKTKKILASRQVQAFTPAELILMQIQGLGEAKVGAILHNYGCLGNAISALSWYDSDEDMPGVITKSIIHDWRETLGISDNFVLYVGPRED